MSKKKKIISTTMVWKMFHCFLHKICNFSSSMHLNVTFSEVQVTSLVLGLGDIRYDEEELYI